MSKRYLSAADVEKLPEHRSQHQFNENAVRQTRVLGSATGMERIGVNLVRLESGRDSTQFHYHDNDEEFIYILSAAAKQGSVMT